MGIDINPSKIEGHWTTGFALDLHTISSTPAGYNEYGHMQFDTVRPPIAECLFQLKNRGDKDAADPIIDAAVTFLKPKLKHSQLLVPVPPSSQRTIQPVLILGDGIARGLGLPFVPCITKTRATQQLKNVTDVEERKKLLEGLYDVEPGKTEGKKVLLFDDLYRSGATMNAVADVLLSKGKAAAVYALTITRTRSNQ
ncbi:MAG: ComF family protein [Proteobacteria bacterium]|nr:ComF family protein [Pseudomonadota bacterium]